MIELCCEMNARALPSNLETQCCIDPCEERMTHRTHRQTVRAKDFLHACVQVYNLVQVKVK